MSLWRDGEEARVEACRVGRDYELRVPVEVHWKEEEDLERCPEARDADVPRGVSCCSGENLEDSLLS
jgi:hypothetical protein